MNLNHKILPVIYNEYSQCIDKKAKKLLIANWANVLKISQSHLYRLLSRYDSGIKKESSTKNNLLKDWAKIIFAIKKMPPDEAGELSTEMAMRIAYENGLIPEEAVKISSSTYNRIARKEGFTKNKKPVTRFMANRPNLAHHFDASHSAYFYVHKKENDEFILKMHRPAKHYKNKPVKDRLRVLVYGLCDDYSGKWIGKYIVAAGETIVDSLLFLQYAWSQIGLPEKLFADQGVLKKGLASAEFIARLGVELPQMKPYEKEGHGKIERPWRTLWSAFERTFFVANYSKNFTITLTELNNALEQYIKEYNSKPHRLFKHKSREAVWREIENYGGIIKIPEHALATVARRYKRKVGQDHIFTISTDIYYVKELIDTWVYAYIGVFDDRVIVEEIETGRKFEAKKFEYREIDEFKGEYKTPHQELKEYAKELEITELPYLKKQSEKVVTLHHEPEVKEEREIANPFDTSKFNNLQEAITELISIIGVRLTPEELSTIKELILEHNLSRDYVHELAFEIRASIETKEAGGDI